VSRAFTTLVVDDVPNVARLAAISSRRAQDEAGLFQVRHHEPAISAHDGGRQREQGLPRHAPLSARVAQARCEGRLATKITKNTKSTHLTV